MGQCCTSEAAPRAAASSSSVRSLNFGSIGSLRKKKKKHRKNYRGHHRDLSNASTEVSAATGDKNVVYHRNGSKARRTNEFEALKALEKVPLLSRLSKKQRQSLCRGLLEVTYDEGVAVFSQGDIGRDFFLIKEGKASVLLQTEDEKGEDEVAVLSAGDYFGESALITSNPRGATVKAKGGNLVCLKLDAAAFESLRKLGVRFGKRNAISAEHLDLDQVETDSAIFRRENRVYDKSEQTKNFILTVFKGSMLFFQLSPKDHQALAAEMYRKEVEEGTVLIRQGERGDNFYIVESGEFIVTIKDDKGIETAVGYPKAGGSFGELALFYGCKRKATVTCTADAVVWAVDRYIFRKTLMRLNDSRVADIENKVRKVKLFDPLLSAEKALIAEALEDEVFQDGDVLFREGEKGDRFYIVDEGECVITKKPEYPSDDEAIDDGSDFGDEDDEVQVCKVGDYFGELSLMRKESRAATATARGTLRVLTLDEGAFTRLLGPLEQVISERAEAIDKQNAERKSQRGSSRRSGGSRGSRGSKGSNVCHVRDRLPVHREGFVHIRDLTDLEIIGTLGRGSFGHVQLVRDSKTKLTYALKEVSRQQVVDLGQQEHILNEKRIMMQLDCNFLIKLYTTFKSDNHLYFLQEVALGGELFNILRSRVRFDEPTARFYTACVVLGFEHMHSANIIFRDLKPENLLLDSQGFLKITDFGFAKICKKHAHTLCGTPDYLAPEMILGRGHNKGVDWWTLGILLYEMLVSYPPFYNEDDQMATYVSIVKSEVPYPAHMSPSAKDLVGRLLERNPTLRIGCTKNGVDDVKSHPFFHGFDWGALARREMRPPIIPRVKDDLDLSNFPPAPDEDGPAAQYIPDPNNADWDDEF